MPVTPAKGDAALSVDAPGAGAGAATAEEWEAGWTDRLDSLRPLHSKWAARHPDCAARGKYWKEGSVGHSTHDIAVPVLSVGGFNGGGYSNATPRLVGQAPTYTKP